MHKNLYTLAVAIVLYLSAIAPSHAANIFRVLDANDGLTDNQVQHILQLPDGRLIVTTLGNINIYDGAQFSYIHKKNNESFDLSDYHGAYHVYIGKNDILWVKNTQHLSCFDLRQMRYVDDIEGMFRKMGITTPVRDVFLDKEKRIWIVTASGLQRVGNRLHYPIPSDAGNLQDIEVDKDNVYLFFETGEVICYKLGKTVMSFRSAAYPKAKRQYYSVTSLVVRGNGNSFFQIRTGKRSIFLVFNTKTTRWQTILETPYLLHTLAITPDDHAYITCPKGYWEYDLTHGKGQLITQLHTDHSETISEAGLNTVFCDSQGGIWIGTYNRGLLYTHPASYRFTSFYTDNGNSKRDYSHVTFHERDYNMIFTDTRGWTWGATNDGLRLMIPGQQSAMSIYTDNGLVNNFIHSVVEDKRGNIWVGTACGISRIAIHSPKQAFAFTNFTRQDGTLDGEYCNGKAKLLKDGRILMEGINGYTVFCPDSVKFQHTVLNPTLTGISLHGEPLAIGKIYDGDLILYTAPPYVSQLNLNYHQNSLSFIFSALNFINAKHTIYRYRLEGTDNRWHIAEATKSNGLVDSQGLLHLSFVNMPCGTYHLQVMASTDINKWQGRMYTVTFIISPPWWQTTLAYIIYAILVICVVSLSIHTYIHVMRNRIRQKQKEEALLKRIQDLVRQVEFDQGDSGKSEGSDVTGTPDEKHQEQTIAMKQEDAEFVRKAAQLVESHINEQGYSVSELSRDLCMERTGLYKKLTALIDESPTLFIRHIRLQKAAGLISEGRLSIGDIAFKTGFSSSSYLSKCFQEEFGCKPSEYHK